MKALFLGMTSIAALLAGGIAQAADLPVKARPMAPVVAPIFNWTGCYIGIEGGGAWGRSKHTNSAGDITPEFDLSGGLVGGTLGCNYQFAPTWVIGVEGDLSWSGKRGSTSDIPPF